MLEINLVSRSNLAEFKFLTQCVLPVSYPPAFYKSVVREDNGEEKVVAYIGVAQNKEGVYECYIMYKGQI